MVFRVIFGSFMCSLISKNNPMKRYCIIVIILLFSTQAWSQENMVTLSGGYAFATIEDTDNQATGYRINGLYEYNQGGGKFAHGFSAGYIHMAAEENNLSQTVTTTVGSWPIYYAPKFLFGREKAKGFIKGALGMQFASLKKDGYIELSDNDFGFYGGFGAGAMYTLSEKMFISAEYEIAWLANGFYKDGWVNSINAGIGFKF